MKGEPDAALRRLAERVGIAAGFHDIPGTWHPATPEGMRAVLAAVGLAAPDEAAAARQLAELDHRAWSRLAPPLAIVPAEAQPGTVPLALPAGAAAVEWHIVLEDGWERTGRTETAELALDASAKAAAASFERRLLPLPAALPEGYHTLRVTTGGTSAETVVAVAPRRCWTLDDAVPGEPRRRWGIACQLYGLRGASDWGIGDFSLLGEIAEAAAAAGAAAIGLNPLHALFPADPGQVSPYFPASRDFLDVLYIDVAAVPEYAAVAEPVETADFQASRDAVRGAAMVDYRAVTALKLTALGAAWAHFRDNATPERRAALSRFREAHGPALHRFATFMALHASLAAQDPALLFWHAWPAGLRHPGSADAAAFADREADAVAFHEWLQFVADEQLAAAAARAEASGLALGLYRDLAVGVGPGSAAAWAEPEVLADGISVGAPPDPFSPLGQDWGLSPIDPLALAETAFAPFRAALAANMRHGGALRIDHAMGLLRLFWVPNGLGAPHGAYVAYPFEAMLRLLALESHRHRCVVIGEDLGTVPEGFRDRMAEAGVLSYRIVQFERWPNGLFKRADTYPEASLVALSTHDLPTVAGFWAGRDIEWRRDLALYPDAGAADADIEARAADRVRLVAALADAGLWQGGPPESLEPALVEALHRFAAVTPSRLMMVQLEDLTGEVEQANLPGTIDSHPNWRRRTPRTIGEIFADPAVRRLLSIVAERGK